MSKHDNCYLKAKKLYRIFPSAYASGYISKCRKVKKAIRKTKLGTSLRRWYKEKWTDSKGKPCGYRKVKIKKCRPTIRINKKTPVTWSELTSDERRRIINMKKKVGMGKRAPSIQRRKLRKKILVI